MGSGAVVARQCLVALLLAPFRPPLLALAVAQRNVAPKSPYDCRSKRKVLSRCRFGQSVVSLTWIPRMRNDPQPCRRNLRHQAAIAFLDFRNMAGKSPRHAASLAVRRLKNARAKCLPVADSGFRNSCHFLIRYKVTTAVTEKIRIFAVFGKSDFRTSGYTIALHAGNHKFTRS